MDTTFLARLQAGDKQAFSEAIKRYGGSMSIAAYGWTGDVELSTKLITALFIRLQGEAYKHATMPLDKYLIGEVKTEYEFLLSLFAP